ncbi:MAG TPA: hypothetical protein ENK85_05475 [Saprospiraceae bacterium]|nr:hypothetical protein [Saprospiraceae bacterium]
MHDKKKFSTSPSFSVASPNESGTLLPILFSECNRYLFSDFEKTKSCLAQIKEAIAPNDKANRITYLHYAALFENQYSNYQAAYDFFEEGRDLIEKITIYPSEAEYYIDFLGTCMNLDKLEKAASLVAKVEQLIHDAPNSLLRPKLLCREGYLNLQLSHWPDATRLLYEALDLFYKNSELLSIKDFHFISLIYSGLGRIYEKTNDPEKSKEAHLKALDICEKHNLKTRLGWHYLSTGNAFAMLGQTNQAISFFKKVLTSPDVASDNVRASAFANWGHCLFNENLAQTAIGLYNKAEEIYIKNPEKNYSNLAIIHRWKGELFAQANQHTSAANHFQKALTFAKKTKNYHELANICDGASTLYAHTQQYKIAFEYQLLKAEFEEQFAEQTNLKTIRELSIKYASEKKKQEIEKLEYQAKALQLRALRAQMNPHFLFNALNSIQNFIAKNNRDEASSYLSSFAKLMRKSLDYSELESISLEKEVDFLEHYLYINKHLRFRNRLEYNIIINPVLVDEDYEIPSMIVQPYVENAIEHGLRSLNAGLITIEFDLFDEDTIRCTISDNGIGRKNAANNRTANPNLQLHQSKGTQITLDRLSMLNSKFKPQELVKIEDLTPNANGQNCGTKVTVLIPI